MNCECLLSKYDPYFAPVNVYCQNTTPILPYFAWLFFVIYVPFVANMNGLHRSCPCPNSLPTNTSPLLAYTKAASAVTTKPLLQPACVRWRFRKRPCPNTVRAGDDD